MLHLTCGISSLLYSVNLILFTVLLVHFILRISPHHSHHLRSHHPSLLLSFTPDLKLISFTNPFLHSHSYSFRTDFTDLNLYWIKGALFVCFSFWLRACARCVRLSCILSFRVHVKLFYCIVTCYCAKFGGSATLSPRVKLSTEYFAPLGNSSQRSWGSKFSQLHFPMWTYHENFIPIRLQFLRYSANKRTNKSIVDADVYMKQEAKLSLG